MTVKDDILEIFKSNNDKWFLRTDLERMFLGLHVCDKKTTKSILKQLVEEKLITPKIIHGDDGKEEIYAYTINTETN